MMNHQEIKVNLEDRCGSVPIEVDNLINNAEINLMIKNTGISIIPTVCVCKLLKKLKVKIKYFLNVQIKFPITLCCPIAFVLVGDLLCILNKFTIINVWNKVVWWVELSMP